MAAQVPRNAPMKPNTIAPNNRLVNTPPTFVRSRSPRRRRSIDRQTLEMWLSRIGRGGKEISCGQFFSNSSNTGQTGAPSWPIICNQESGGQLSNRNAPGSRSKSRRAVRVEYDLETRKINFTQGELWKRQLRKNSSRMNP